MKITDKRAQLIPFRNLKEGDTFTWGTGDIYMKTVAIIDEDFGVRYTAVKLKNGDHCFISENEMVFKINGELVIE